MCEPRNMVGRRRHRGMSLLETLVAMGLLATVALFSVQPFASVLGVVMRGRESTAAAIFVGSEVDVLHRLPGELDPLALTEGEDFTNKRLYLAEGATRFVEAIPRQRLRWVLDVTVTQHNLEDFEADADGLSNLDTPLAGGTSSSFVHVKRIEMRLRAARQGGSLGAGLHQQFVIYRTP